MEELIKLFYIIENEPNNIVVYRKIIDYYEKNNQNKLAEAFRNLIYEKYKQVEEVY
jgi:transcription elongation factor GreA-like protein